MKNLIIAAIMLAAFSTSAVAQTITAKCPCSDSLTHWEYKKFPQTNMEAIYSPDGETVITLDWLKNEVTYNGDTYPMQSFGCSAIEPAETITFYGLELTLKYKDTGKYRGHILKEKSPQR